MPYHASSLDLELDLKFALDVLINTSDPAYMNSTTQMKALQTLFNYPRKNNMVVLRTISGFSDVQIMFNVGVNIESHEMNDHLLPLVNPEITHNLIQSISIMGSNLSLCIALRHQAYRDHFTEEAIENLIDHFSIYPYANPHLYKSRAMKLMYLLAYFPQNIQKLGPEHFETPADDVAYFLSSINQFQTLYSFDHTDSRFAVEFAESKGSKQKFCELLLSNHGAGSSAARFALLHCYKTDPDTTREIINLTIEAHEFVSLPSMLIVIKREQPGILKSLRDMILGNLGVALNWSTVLSEFI